MSALTGAMHFARSGHQATLLTSGKVLVSGGKDANNQLVGTAEIYDPQSGAWALTGALNNARVQNAAVLLGDGKVLVAGGTGANGPLASAEIYDPVSGTWTPASTMDRPRSPLMGVALGDGRILIVGVNAQGVDSALYDSASSTWASVPVAGGGSPGQGPSSFVTGLAVLSGGHTALTVFGAVVGAGFGAGPVLASTLFDVQTGVWGPTGGGLVNSNSGPLVALPDGRALLAGTLLGSFTSGRVGLAQLFRPDNSTPRLVVTPLTVDFGKTNPGNAVQRVISLQSTGGATLTGSAATTAPFTVVSGSPFILAPGASTTLTAQFTPPGFGSFTGTLQFTSNGNALSVPMTAGAGVRLSGRIADSTGAEVGGVTMNLTGATTGDTVTDTTGHYQLFVPPNNGYNITPVSPGLTSTPSTRSVVVGTQDVSGLDFVATFSPTHIGVFRNGFWFLDLNSNAQWDGCGADRCLPFGAPGDRPIVGDWSGTGKTKIGVFRNGIWSLDFNGNGQWDGCTIDRCPTFGQAGDEPVVGDWAGSGHANIGVFRNGAWFLDVNGNGEWDGCLADACLSFGAPGDLPVVGDWAGDGTARIGVFRNGAWYLDRNGNGQFDGCGVDVCVAFGQAGDLPVVGDWTGTGHDRIGVFRDGGWYLDLNGNGVWDGCIVDACIGFGQTGDHAVAGFW